MSITSWSQRVQGLPLKCQRIDHSLRGVQHVSTLKFQNQTYSTKTDCERKFH